MQNTLFFCIKINFQKIRTWVINMFSLDFFQKLYFLLILIREIITYSFLSNQELVNFTRIWKIFIFVRKRSLVWKKFYIFALIWAMESLWSHFFTRNYESSCIITCKFYKISFYLKFALKFHLTLNCLQISFKDEIRLWSWTSTAETFEIIHVLE